ncbi:MAG: 50S ribosomal protein L19 [bacterium]|nr:50S ribosomal protein L19 [bacterium]
MTQLALKASYLKKELPVFSSGDMVKVYQRIKEGEKERVQVFEGLVIGRHGGAGINATYTVRKISSGVGVERILPLHSPNIIKLEVVKPGKVRKAQLNYVRGRQDNQPRFRKSRIKK